MIRIRSIALAAGVLAVSSLCARAQPEGATPVRVYFGTYTGEKSRGIYTALLDPESGRLSGPELAAETINPSFLALHPSGRFLYAVNEVTTFEGASAGAVSAFQIERPTGKLVLINQESSRGGAPCHLVVDNAGRNVLVANYAGGSVAVLPIGEEGALQPASSFVQHQGASEHPQRQRGPHAHSINLDAGNRFAVCADLGLDQLLIYKFDSRAGTLDPHDPAFARVPPRSGPRHFAFHPAQRHAYVINELNCTVTTFRYDPGAGELSAIQTLSTLPPGESLQAGFSTAEVQVHPSGRFVYGSNRGHDSIAVFEADARTGALRWVENQPTQGRTPRNFSLDPSGRFLLAANQNSDTVVVFAVDGASGKLAPTGHQIEVGRPVCVRFLVHP